LRFSLDRAPCPPKGRKACKNEETKTNNKKDGLMGAGGMSTAQGGLFRQNSRSTWSPLFPGVFLFLAHPQAATTQNVQSSAFGIDLGPFIVYKLPVAMA
jgi:hypothetical protein